MLADKCLAVRVKGYFNREYKYIVYMFVFIGCIHHSPYCCFADVFKHDGSGSTWIALVVVSLVSIIFSSLFGAFRYRRRRLLAVPTQGQVISLQQPLYVDQPPQIMTPYQGGTRFSLAFLSKYLCLS
jgi:hypothetical protein